MACSLKLLTLSPWQLTPLRGMELEASLKSSPQLEQVTGSFLRVIWREKKHSEYLFTGNTGIISKALN